MKKSLFLGIDALSDKSMFAVSSAELPTVRV